MRRILTLGVACIAVLAYAPAALAHGHHRGRHHRSHSVHSVRHRRFGSSDPATQSGQPQSVGTITSFTNGVLTIALTDSSGSPTGNSVSGQVTNATNLQCTSSSSSTQGDGDNEGDNGSNGDNDQNNATSGDDNGGNNTTANGGDDNGDNNTNANGGDDNGGNNTTANSGDDNGGSNSGDDNGGDNDGANGDQGDGGQMCSSASLTPGTHVQMARLEITNAGSIWDTVELITS